MPKIGLEFQWCVAKYSYYYLYCCPTSLFVMYQCFICYHQKCIVSNIKTNRYSCIVWESHFWTMYCPDCVCLIYDIRCEAITYYQTELYHFWLTYNEYSQNVMKQTVWGVADMAWHHVIVYLISMWIVLT